MRTLSLDSPQQNPLTENVESLTGDVGDRDVVLSAMRGAGLVIHLAALLHIAHPTQSMEREYWRVNVEGTNNIVTAARDAGVRRICLFSTINVYGPSGGSVLDEGSPVNPGSIYARTKLEAEKVVLSARCQDGSPMGTVLRLGAIYGPRVKGNYRSLLMSLARGRFVPVGSGMNRRSLVYERDVASATVQAAIHDRSVGRIYNVTDGRIHTVTEIVAAMCSALGRKPPRVAVPLAPARVVAKYMDEATRCWGRRRSALLATLDKYTEDVAVSSERIRSELGFTPQVDLMTGWQETVLQMRRNGEL